MTPSRPYIPSAALIRALTRPQPLRCPLARPLPAQFVRGKKSKAAKAREAESARLARQARRDRHIKDVQGKAQAKGGQSAQQNQYLEEAHAQARDGLKAEDDGEYAERMLKAHKKKKLPGTAGALLDAMEELEDPKVQEKLMREPDEADFPKDGEDIGINFYEMDLDKGTKRKLDYFGTVESRKRYRETNRMIVEAENNPDYDDSELNRRMVDFLIADPSFAHLTEELKAIKAGILTPEDKAEIEAQAERESKPLIARMNTIMRLEIHDSITYLLNEPEIGDAKADLEALLDKLSEVEDLNDPEFQAILHKATDKVNSNPKLEAKMRERNEAKQEVPEAAKFDEFAKDLMDPHELDLDEDGLPSLAMQKEIQDDMYDLMRKMRGLMKDLKVEGNIAELDRAIAQPPLNLEKDDNGIYFNEDMDPAQLADELTKLAEAKSKEPPAPDPEPEEEEEEEHISPELKAKVDKIMADPNLIQKLMYIQKLIAEANPQKDPNDLTQIDAELAPDPYELDDSQTATVAERMAFARADPEHSAALRRLRIRLQPPFNISPALKSFNQALEFAYVGANDDIRRILWRCYMKARSLPTFLHNMNDEAWDLVFYSQAVYWKGNQNRTAHLKLVLADLEKVGRNGPPTHPSTLGKEAAEEVQQ